MRPLLKNQYFLFIVLLLVATTAYSQKEFFRSQQSFKEGQLDKFYSSITIHDTTILFNANDYYVYAYNKNNGSLKWSYKTNYKTTIPVFVTGNIVYAAASKDENESAVQLSLVDGKLIKELPFGPLQTRPIIKNGILYGTAIYDFGCIVAYDLAKDTVSWSRFIAHGLSNQPYYFDNKILANAEGSNWFELGYDGVLLDTTCSVKASLFVENIPCVKNFTALSHDGLEINGKLAEDILGDIFFGMPPMLTTDKFTYIFYDDKLTILSGKLKIKQQVQISSLSDSLIENSNTKLLKADNENIWILYGNHLLQYNHKIKKLIILTDLSAWQPDKLLLDEGNIWLVSGKDGLLYGLNL
ncbi:MAG: hypothetical protein ABIO79_14485 [Ferruginibacter sp.]